GDNNALSNAYGLKNLRRIMPNIPAWNHEENGQYDEAANIYGELLTEYQRFMNHVLAYVGGRERTYKSEDQPGDIYAPVPRTEQEQALAFFNAELFSTPNWLLDPLVVNKLAAPMKQDFITGQQGTVLKAL